jgi:hypothetical protein
MPLFLDGRRNTPQNLWSGAIKKLLCDCGMNEVWSKQSCTEKIRQEILEYYKNIYTESAIVQMDNYPKLRTYRKLFNGIEMQLLLDIPVKFRSLTANKDLSQVLICLCLFDVEQNTQITQFLIHLNLTLKLYPFICIDTTHIIPAGSLIYMIKHSISR